MDRKVGMVEDIIRDDVEPLMPRVLLPEVTIIVRFRFSCRDILYREVPS